MSSIKSFINDHFDIIFKSDHIKEDLSNATEFLLCEMHGSPLHRVINSLFIKNFANAGDIALMEGFPSMKIIDPQESTQSMRLRTTQAQIMGWDWKIYKEMFNQEEMHDSNLMSLALEKERLIDDILNSETDENMTSKEEKYIDTYLKIADKQGGYEEQFLEEVSSSENANLYPYLEHFPERTDAMITSLDQASKTAKRVFLIAGGLHLNKQDLYRKSWKAPAIDWDNIPDQCESLASMEKRLAESPISNLSESERCALERIRAVSDSLDRFYESAKSRNVVILDVTQDDSKLTALCNGSSDSPAAKAIKKELEMEKKTKRWADIIEKHNNRVMSMKWSPITGRNSNPSSDSTPGRLEHSRLRK